MKTMGPPSPSTLLHTRKNIGFPFSCLFFWDSVEDYIGHPFTPTKSGRGQPKRRAADMPPMVLKPRPEAPPSNSYHNVEAFPDCQHLGMNLPVTG